MRIVLAKGVAIGPGKADLLAAIDECGSIAAAGRSMGMSYQRAWSLVDELNRTFRSPLVAASRGGSERGGARLTLIGREVLAGYRAIEQTAATACQSELDKMVRLTRRKVPISLMEDNGGLLPDKAQAVGRRSQNVSEETN